MASASDFDPNQHSLAELLALQTADKQEKFFESLNEDEQKLLMYDWQFWGRPKQLAPPGDWQFWLILAGRGFGKTRSGAEWVHDQVMNHGARRVALVGETIADTRKVLVEGQSGILNVAPPWECPVYSPSNRQLTWPNGAIATTYGAEKPDQLRGPEHDCAWGDELAKWRYADAWDQLCMGLRMGNNPQAIITTTPRPTPIIKELVKDPLCHVTRGSTFENRGNVADKWLQKILRKYEGTRLGRQELNAEILDDAPGALWKRADIDKLRVSQFPELERIVVAIDPSVSSDSAEAATGIVAAGLGTDGHGYVLGDSSLIQPTPDQWAQAAVALYNTLEGDRVIGEVNNGGDLVEANLRAADPKIPYSAVRASRGKHKRAEPVAAFYEQGKVHHVGSFPELEDEMCQWEQGVSTWSPNRMDALVWALTELMLGHRATVITYDDQYDADLPDLRM